MSRPPRRVVHLSDVHLLGEPRPRGALERVATALVSYARRLDPAGRRRKLVRALAEARRLGADEVVISGDLTELGTSDQFEELAGALHGSGIDPDGIVLVPGNHDLYTAADGWRRALGGPLRAFARAAAEAAGKIVERGDMAYLPVDATVFQPITRSNGFLAPDAAEALARRLADPALARRSVAVVLHHPPVPHGDRVRQWIDGLIGHGILGEILARHGDVQVLHGHQHRRIDRTLGSAWSRALGASAVVDDREDAGPRVRLYELVRGRLAPVEPEPPARVA